MPVSKVEACFDKETHRTEALVILNSVIGRWRADDIDLTLYDDGTTDYNGRKGSYKINYPQMGMITLFFNDGATLPITVMSVSETVLTITFPPYTQNYKLKK